MSGTKERRVILLPATGATWIFSDLDGPGVPGGAGRTGHQVGAYAAATVDPAGGVIDVLYADETAHALRHARHDAAGWSFETIDGTGSLQLGSTTHNVGRFNAVA
jgi:hypothetical protein